MWKYTWIPGARIGIIRVAFCTDCAIPGYGMRKCTGVVVAIPDEVPTETCCLRVTTDCTIPYMCRRAIASP